MKAHQKSILSSQHSARAVNGCAAVPLGHGPGDRGALAAEAEPVLAARVVEVLEVLGEVPAQFVDEPEEWELPEAMNELRARLGELSHTDSLGVQAW